MYCIQQAQHPSHAFNTIELQLFQTDISGFWFCRCATTSTNGTYAFTTLSIHGTLWVSLDSMYFACKTFGYMYDTKKNNVGLHICLCLWFKFVLLSNNLQQQDSRSISISLFITWDEVRANSCDLGSNLCVGHAVSIPPSSILVVAQGLVYQLRWDKWYMYHTHIYHLWWSIVLNNV
jgi:hypothetical protein